MTTAIKKILVPVDGSGTSEKALNYAVSLALLTGAQVDLVHVVSVTAGVSAFTHISPNSYVSDSVIEAVQEVGQEVLDAANKMIPEGIASEAFMELGSAPTVIIDLCRKNDYDQIVMGSRGMGTVKGMLLGSVSKHILQYAPCPVTIVK